MAPGRMLWLRRVVTATALAVALGYLPYHLYGRSGLARYLRLRAERDALHETNLKLREANRQLRAELEAISDTDGDQSRSLLAIERAARDELGLVKPGEVVFRIQAARP